MSSSVLDHRVVLPIERIISSKGGLLQTRVVFHLKRPWIQKNLLRFVCIDQFPKGHGLVPNG